jgi:hypothetical protein
LGHSPLCLLVNGPWSSHVCLQSKSGTGGKFTLVIVRMQIGMSQQRPALRMVV